MRFAAIGLDHRHIYDLVAGLHEAGQECAGYCPETSDPRVLEGFRKRFPDTPAKPRDALFDDPSIAFIVTAAIPCDRPAIAIAAMRRGKDVMVDKPAVASFAQLQEIERVVAETGRIWSVCFSERFLTPSTLKALETRAIRCHRPLGANHRSRATSPQPRAAPRVVLGQIDVRRHTE